MNARQLLLVLASVFGSSPLNAALAQETKGQYVQVAEIEIDPGGLEAYKIAVQEQIEAAIRDEPGVLVLYAVAQRDDPTRVKVFEVYRDMDAYRAHLQSPHFKKYKARTENMVRSLKLIQQTPIMLGAKPR
jgi:quinol monooxygenase YgiN